MINKILSGLRSSMYLRMWAIAASMAVVIGLGFFVRHQPGATTPVIKKASRTSGTDVRYGTELPLETVPTTPSPAAAPAGANATTAAANNQVKYNDELGHLLATFTVGSRTVLFNGPFRTFREPTATDATVTTNSWVRLYPAPFAGNVDPAWVKQMAEANAKNSPTDVLGTAMQYLNGAPKILDATGHVIAGDASFGPLGPDNFREEGADFNDFIGIPWTYDGNVVDRPEAAQLYSLDCSGFQRMVWGYRNGLPLELSSPGGALSRRVYQIYNTGPGIIIAPNTGKQMTDFSKMQVGDVAFLDVEPDDGPQLDHMGIYLGVDSHGDRRFLSSRKTANGPTFGDIDGKAILNGTSSYFAQRFRAVRRF